MAAISKSVKMDLCLIAYLMFWLLFVYRALLFYLPAGAGSNHYSLVRPSFGPQLLPCLNIHILIPFKLILKIFPLS